MQDLLVKDSKPTPPPADIIRKVMRENDLEERLGSHKSSIPKIKGCLQGIINRHFKYKKNN